MSVAKILLSISALLLLMFDYRMAFKNGPIEPEKKKHGWEIKPAAEDQMLKGVQFLGRSGHQVVRSWS
jgi:hypothetical protein